MIKTLRNFVKKVLQLLTMVSSQKIDTLLLSQGKALEEIFTRKVGMKLCDYEWKIFSQWGEDGIIQFLIREVEIVNTTFIEFGVEDFSESNCRYLLMSSGWQGFVIDGSEYNINSLKKSYYYWKYDIQSSANFVNTTNINETLAQSKFENDLGILSVDIDGNDYHILTAIDNFDPRIIICEFNPIFGVDRAITVPYDPLFNRTEKHYSNLYFGASIKALELLMQEKGYTLVGTGKMGCNAYFVKNELMTEKLTILQIIPTTLTITFEKAEILKANSHF